MARKSASSAERVPDDVPENPLALPLIGPFILREFERLHNRSARVYKAEDSAEKFRCVTVIGQYFLNLANFHKRKSQKDVQDLVTFVGRVSDSS